VVRPRVALLGTPGVALPSLEALASLQSLDVVITGPDRPSGRGQNLIPSPVKTRALALDIPIVQPDDWSSPATQATWRSLKVDLAFVIAYGSILPPWMIDSCRLGVWNLHFSKLPRWRGAAPVNYAIWKGDEEVGVSLMKISPTLDAGPIVDYLHRPITLGSDTLGLLEILASDGAQLIEKHWSALIHGSCSLMDQDDQKATWAPKLTKACAGTLSWSHGEGVWLTAGDGYAVGIVSLQRAGKGIQAALQALQPWGHQGQKSLLPS